MKTHLIVSLLGIAVFLTISSVAVADFCGQARIGSNRPPELILHESFFSASDPSAVPIDRADFDYWQNGGSVDFLLTFGDPDGDGDSDLVFSLDDGTNTAEVVYGDLVESFNGFHLWASTNPKEQRGTTFASCSVTDLALNGQDLGLGLYSEGNGPGRDFLALENLTLSDVWELSGTLTFAWEGTQPRNSEAHFGICGFYEPAIVPEPASCLLVGLGLAALGVRRRLSKKN